MKALLLNDGRSYNNWGIQACTDGLLSILKDNNPGLEIIGIPYHVLHQKYNWDIKIWNKSLFNADSRVAKHLFKENHLAPRIADEYEYVAERWITGKAGDGAEEIMAQLSQVEAVIFNAEGSTYRKNIAAIKSLFILWLAATKFKKHTYFVNGSITLTHVDAVLPAMLEKTFSTITAASVREPYSIRSVEQHCPSVKDINLHPDAAFYLNFNKEDIDSNLVNGFDYTNEPFFCFSLSMLPMDFIRTKSESALISLLKDLKKIVPNIIFLAKDNEDQILQDVAQYVDGKVVDKNCNYQQIMTLLSYATFLFSGRYHHLIFAAKVGCPCIPLASSSHKIHGLAELFPGVMPKVKDPTNLWEQREEVLSEAKYILSHQVDLRDNYADKSKILSRLAKAQGLLTIKQDSQAA